MTAPARPAVNTLVMITTADGQTYDSRVEELTDDGLGLAAPRADLATGALTVSWSAGARGRYALPVSVVTTSGADVGVWVVRPTGNPQLEQHREYVRGGGGELLRMRPADAPTRRSVRGHVMDVGERSVRGRFAATDVEVAEGDQVWLQMTLGDAVVVAIGEVRQVSGDADWVDFVAIYDIEENQARLIRRYVMRQQALARARFGAD